MSTLHLLVLMLLLNSVCTHASSSLQQEVADGDRRALLAVKLELSDPMGWLRCLPVDRRDMQPPAPRQGGVGGHVIETALRHDLSGDRQPHVPAGAQP